MAQDAHFEFTDDVISNEVSAFVARLPRGLSSKDELLQALYESLQFPGYFGFNWDALSDCFRDLHWIESPVVVLVHPDVPQLEPGELDTYLELLAEAVDSWRQEEDRVFRVVFPAEARERLTLR